MNEQKAIVLLLVTLCMVLLMTNLFAFMSNLNMQSQVVQINNKAYHMQQGMIEYAADNNFDMNGYFTLYTNSQHYEDFDWNNILSQLSDGNA